MMTLHGECHRKCIRPYPPRRRSKSGIKSERGSSGPSGNVSPLLPSTLEYTDVIVEKKALTAANEAASIEIHALYNHIEGMRKTINSLKAFTGDTDLVQPLPARAFAPPPETPEPESGTGTGGDTGALGLNVDGHDQ